MTHTTQMSRRRFCWALGGLPILAGCAGGSDSAFQAEERPVTRNVAALLPLSGPQAELGAKMAKSIWLAEDLGASLSRTRILDAGDTPDTAVSAARQAVGEGADIIIGPLFSSQTGAVVQAAAGIPVLSLSNDNALTDQGAWVFGVTPAQSAGAVLRYAKSAGARRITMLETPGTLGARAATALASGTTKAGVSLLPPVPGGTKPDQMTDALRQAGSGSLPDIIYVPSASPAVLDQAVAAVASGVTTIGSLQWSGLPEAQFTRLEKACYTGPSPQRFDRLSASFRAQLDEDMGVIGALAVDAVAFAQSVQDPGNLSRGKPVDGLLGATAFNPDRTASRDLSVLRIDGGGGVVQVA